MRLSAERTKRIEIPNDPDGGFINIVLLDLDLRSKIDDASAIVTYGANDDQSVKFQPGKREDNIAKKCLRGWGNLFDVKGSDLKFKRANFKEAAKFAIDIDGERVRFFKFVADEHDKFVVECESEEREATKN